MASDPRAGEPEDHDLVPGAGPGHAQGDQDDGTVWWEPDDQWDEPEDSPRAVETGESSTLPDEGGTWRGEAVAWTQPTPARRGGRRGAGPWPELVMAAAVAVIVAAVALAITSADRSSAPTPTSLASGTGTSRATSSGPAQPNSSKPPPSRARAGRPTGAPPSSPPASQPVRKASGGRAPGGAVQLAVTPQLERQLVRSWLSANPGHAGLTAADVAGTVPGQVYYGYEPSTKTYWAEAAFRPSPALLRQVPTAAGQVKVAQFQNWLYVFSWRQGPLWTWVGDVPSGACPNQFVPAPVLAAWRLCG